MYQDHTSGAQKADDIVRPGQIYTYRWTVPEQVGPTSADAQCVTWLYYSSVDPVKDTYSGEPTHIFSQRSIVRLEIKQINSTVYSPDSLLMISIVSNWISIYQNWALWCLFVISTHLSNNFPILAVMSQLFPFLIYSSYDAGFFCEYLFSLLHSLRGRLQNGREMGQVFASEKRERKKEGLLSPLPPLIDVFQFL